MQYQFYWTSWGLSYRKDPDEHYPVYWNWLIIGPLQMRWTTQQGGFNDHPFRHHDY
jgi:hypothetical protein